MILGYNTNGFAHHPLESAIEVIASIGYGAVAITIDHAALSPLDPRNVDQLKRVADLLARLNLECVVETGGRFLLDPLHKHEPNLVSPSEQSRAERVAFYRYAVDVAERLGARCVSLWSGAPQDGAPPDVVMERLVSGLEQVLDHASERGVIIGFEPEPGMAVETLDSYRGLAKRLGDPVGLRLTLDVGHLHCNGETPIAGCISDLADQIVNVHIEDMRAGVHEHLRFGEGEIDFPPVLAALKDIGYAGPLTVELSRHGHMAPAVARESFLFLNQLLD